MRRPSYLSPTSMSKWAEDPNLYYLKYLSSNPLPSEPQSMAMSVGSAFDAYVKSFLYEHLFGHPSKAGNDETFLKDALFEEQVEEHNRDFARKAGEHCFTWYRILGALDGLMLDLGKSQGPPKFEMKVFGTVTYGADTVVSSVPYHVRPDLHYINEHGAFVILDWKVNGYCSKNGISPAKGFVRARRNGMMPWTHADCDLGTFKGLTINTRNGLEKYDSEWAKQCSVGAWVCGAKMLDDYVCVIHQLACAKDQKITVAEHVAHVTPAFQEQIHKEASVLWDAITTVVHTCNNSCGNCKGQGCYKCATWVGPREKWIFTSCECIPHVFKHLSKADSDALCGLLDQRKEIMVTSRNQFINPALDW